MIDDLAGQLPARFTAWLLGLDEDEWWPTLKVWSERLMRLDAAKMDNDVSWPTHADAAGADGHGRREARGVRGCPADGLLSTWANATMLDGSPMPVETIFHETGLFVSGGSETTRTAIAHGLRTFCDHNDQWELLHDHPEHLPTAVDEVIRWVTPLNNMFRKATQDVELRGVHDRGGRPGRCSSTRRPTATRRCSTTRSRSTSPARRTTTSRSATAPTSASAPNFARHELELLFGKLTRDWTNLRVVTEPDVELNHFARAVRSFELAFDARR